MANKEDIAPRRKTLNELLEITKQRGTANSDIAEQKAVETQRQMFLPGFDIGAFPNHLNRSSFIAPIARGRRKFHRQTEMVTRRDCVLEYTGEQLDEADGDLVMALIACAQPYAMGVSVPLHRAELLRKLKRSNGKTQYEWLHRRIKALTEATLFLEAKKPDGSTRYSIGKTVSFRIIASFSYDDESEKYIYSLDPRWVQMFGNREYSLLNWHKRMQIGRGQDMAKTLQRLLATSADPIQRYALDWLKDKMEYAGRVRDFRDAITRAVHELERLEIVAKGRIEDSTKGNPQLVLRLQPMA